jgi:hypothetical protein
MTTAAFLVTIWTEAAVWFKATKAWQAASEIFVDCVELREKRVASHAEYVIEPVIVSWVSAVKGSGDAMVDVVLNIRMINLLEAADGFPYACNTSAESTVRAC